jgi:hypothetical protein
VIYDVPARETLLRIARGHTWVRETGPNRGQAVEAILKRVGLEPGKAWCAAFVAYIGWLLMREQWPLPLVGGCESLAEALEARPGMLTDMPQPGAIFLLPSEEEGRRYRHTGFVWELKGPQTYSTVEGNASPDGSPEGTGVFVRERTIGPKDRFGRWWA